MGARVRLIGVESVGYSRVIFSYSNGKSLVITRADYIRALGEIANAEFDTVVQKYAIEVID